MDALDFLDENYGLCFISPNSNRWIVSLLLIALLATILIKKTGSDLEQTRKRYLGLEDVD